ncbi:MAG: 50S ribosomal protein L4 [Candidatus Falkowbacteria bacterium]
MSVNIKIYNQKAEAVGDMKLADKIFGAKENVALVHQVAVAQIGNERQVLAHTKDRSEVRGGGKKPWKQKGTGRARVGSTRSPIWIGGGVTFGPTKERNFKKNINRKMKQKAIFIVLSDRIKNGSMVLLEKLEAKEYKTKAFNEILKNLENKVLNKDNKENKKQKRSVLIVNDKKDDKVKYSGRNLAGVEMINLENINILDLLKYRNLFITVDGVKKLEKQYK